MARKSKIKKNIKFYKKKMRKWELRISFSLILIILGVSFFYYLYLEACNWNITNMKINLYEYSKLSILSPFFFCLRFSVSQFNYYKKQMDLYKLKYSDL